MNSHTETDRKDVFDFQSLYATEYVEANGLGGYASGTFSGAHSRRYHGLLVASLKPPVQRHVVVSKIDETVLLGGKYYNLGCNQFPGAVYPFGVQYITSFRRHLFPEWTYAVEGLIIRKTIAAVYGENTTVVLYEVLDAPEKFDLELQPFYSCRDFHSLSATNENIGRPYIFNDGVFRTMNYQGSPEFFISVPKSDFVEQKAWYERFEYLEEMKRGLDFEEDLFTHGKFTVPARKGSKIGVIVSLRDPSGRDASGLLREERRRREAIIKGVSSNEHIQALALAADQFVVRRDEMNTIIAGYPWFADWGRDTMIALPGLCLSLKRYDEAKRILQKFSEYISEGMVPNRFPDSGEVPEYNTIDATLWFFNATYKYYKATNDDPFLSSVLPLLRECIQCHYRGTRHNIRVDPNDGLLSGGEEGVQLTWMDAKVDGWVVTPRKGKAVEICALWYNALCIMEFFCREVGVPAEADDFRRKAVTTKDNFNKAFWNTTDNCLFDYIEGDFYCRDIRPNQLYAVALPFPVLEKDKAFFVLRVVREQLLTPRGLRSLSPLHSEYRGTYSGGVRSRDSAYHQGTVWSHLSGIYIDALFTTLGEQARDEAALILESFFGHFHEAGLGTVSEVFDGDPPHRPGGCISQAWSVAELLRVAQEYNLSQAPKKQKGRPNQK